MYVFMKFLLFYSTVERGQIPKGNTPFYDGLLLRFAGTFNTVQGYVRRV